VYYCHFVIVEVTEVELQAVLNTLTEHEFKNGRRAWNGAYTQKRDYLKGDGGQHALS
jgi:hypothetical protein